MIVTERLPPVGQSELRINSLRFAKGIARVFELKAVERLHAGEEGRLSLRRAGVRKVDGAQVRCQAIGEVATNRSRNGRAVQTQSGPQADD